jgi:hypothetical protein
MDLRTCQGVLRTMVRPGNPQIYSFISVRGEGRGKVHRKIDSEVQKLISRPTGHILLQITNCI